MSYQKIEKKKQDAYNKIIERLVPIAKEVVGMIGDAARNNAVVIGAIGGGDKGITEDAQKSYAELSKKITEYLLEKNINYGERYLVFQLAFQAFEQTRDNTIQSLERYCDIAIEHKVGKSMEDLTLVDLDSIIKEKFAK